MPTAFRACWFYVPIVLLWACQATAEEVASSTDSLPERPVSIATQWELARDPGEYRPRAGLRYFAPHGMGYRNVILGLDGFVPILQLDRSLLFGDVRAILHDGQFGFNAGMGHRFYSVTLDKSLGVYGFFDNMNTGNRTISQVSGGFDILGSSWEARANLYFPLDRNAQVVRTPLADSIFEGNQLLANRILVHETGLTAIDFESGHLLYEKLNLWGFLGAYHLQGANNPHTWGGKARLELRVSDKFTVQFSLQHDEIFNTNAIISASLQLPGYRPARSTNQDLAPDRLAFPIERTQHIIVAESTSVDQILPLNPNTGQPFDVVHVGDVSSSGNGTFESPFQTLQEALDRAGPNSIIYVQPNAGGYQESLHLQPGQIVLGSGTTHVLPTVQGTTEIPRLTDNRVLLINSPGNAITLADRSIVAGLDILNPHGAGIFGEGVWDPVIADTTIQGGTYGIQLINAMGSSSIQNNIIHQTRREGISIVQNNGAFEVAIAGNTVKDNLRSGAGNGAIALSSSGSSQLSATALGNTISGSSSDGLNLRATGNANLDVTATGNTIESNTRQGIAATIADAATANLSISNNTIRSNEYGVDLRAENSSKMSVLLSQNWINSNRFGGLKIASSQKASLSGTASKNVIENNQGDGARILVTEDALLNVAFSENTFAKNSVALSIASDGSEASFANVSFLKNTVTEHTSHGMDVAISNFAELNLTLEENDFSNNEGDGLRVFTSGSSLLRWQLSQNRFHLNDNGISLLAESDASKISTLQATGNVFSNNRIDGMHLAGTKNSILHSTITNNRFEKNEGNGLDLSVSDFSKWKADIANNAFTDNQATGLLLTSEGTTVDHELRTLVRNNTITGSVSPGMLAQTKKNGRLFLELKDNDSSRGFHISNLGDADSRLHFASDGNDGGIVPKGTILPADIGTLYP